MNNAESIHWKILLIYESDCNVTVSSLRKYNTGKLSTGSEHNEYSQRWEGISILVVVLVLANHLVWKNPRGNYGQCEKCDNYEKWPPS
jgi:hypothetical protein